MESMILIVTVVFTVLELQLGNGLTIDVPSAITIAEDEIAPGGVLTEIRLEGETEPLQYMMNDAYFTINEVEKVVVLGTNPLDFESLVNKTIPVTFSVSDVNGAVDHTIAVTVTDGNDAPSFDGYVLERGGFLVSSEATPGRLVGSVAAADEDKSSLNNQFTYRIATSDTPFSVNNAGDIMINRNLSAWKHVQLWDKRVWPVVVEAVDTGTPPRTGSILVPICVCGIATVEET